MDFPSGKDSAQAGVILWLLQGLQLVQGGGL